MKILILSDGIPPYIMGGMQRHTLNLVKHLVLIGAEVTLVHCANEGEGLKSQEEISEELFENRNQPGFISMMIEFPKPGKFPGHYIRRSYNYSKSVFEKVKGQVDTYDFIYIKGFSGWKLLEHKERFSVPMGVNFHGYEMFQAFPDFKTRIKNQVLIKPVRKNIKKADYVFSYGGGIDKLLENEGIASEQIVSIHGAVDETWFDSNTPKEVQKQKKLLFVGRFERRKGIEELNALLPSFLKKHDFSIDFVGPIPDSNKLSHPKVNYIGEVKSVDKIKEIYRSHDILIAPSYSEGMPNVIMEAMSQGLAVLATDVGATSLLVDDSNGWLMPEMNMNTLSEYLNIVVSSNSEDVLSKKIKSKEKLNSDFSWTKIAKKHIEEIQRLVNP